MVEQYLCPQLIGGISLGRVVSGWIRSYCLSIMRMQVLQNTNMRRLASVVMSGFLLLVLVGARMCMCAAEDLTNLGGALSTDLEGRNAIQVSAPNVVGTARAAEQAAGFSVFHRTTGVAEGLGPKFVNNSCAGCHIDNGRGPTTFGVPSRGGSSMIIKVKRRGLLGDGSAPEVPGIGGQVLDQTVGAPIKRTVKVTWEPVPGRYKDGTPYTLRKPTIVLPKAYKVPRGAALSLRMSPPLIGMGLLEAVQDSLIVRSSDARDANGDGISGRVNWVRDRVKGGYSVGKFGLKGNHPTVLQQSASALYHDMQIENPIFQEKDGIQEATDQDLHSLAIYLRLAGVPKARSQNEPSVLAGKDIFKQLRCDACHTMTMVTGVHPDPELSNQTIHPFTDLLLHDMGPRLSDGWNEYSAGPQEWRTTPLWGLGFSAQLAKRRAFYLHDGRARTIEEAILWHGGEAAASQKAFTALPAVKRRRLIDFLNSL